MGAYFEQKKTVWGGALYELQEAKYVQATREPSPQNDAYKDLKMLRSLYTQKYVSTI